MPSLAELMEDYRNWRGRSEWEQGKGWQDFFGGDPRAQEQFEKLSGFGTDAGGLVGMVKSGHIAPQEKLAELIQNLESQGLNVDAFYNPKSNQVSLSRIVVPKESRGQGIGTKAMQDLIDFADEQNALMSLSPSTDFGATSINRLKDFYSRFGFVPNKGKYKDYSISESMYRPKK